MANDKVETHRLSCLSCSASFNAKGKMPIGNNLSLLQNISKRKKSLEHPKRSKKKHKQDIKDT